jgi:hypothetical protein
MEKAKKKEAKILSAKTNRDKDSAKGGSKFGKGTHT